MYVMEGTCMLWSGVQGMLCSGCSRANINLIWEEGKQSRVLPKKNKARWDRTGHKARWDWSMSHTTKHKSLDLPLTTPF